MAKINLLEKMRKKKAVFLDLDNTLYAYRPCHKAGIMAAYRDYAKHLDKIPFAEFMRRYRAAREVIHHRFHGKAQSHSRLQYFQVLLKQKFGWVDLKNARRLDRVYWQTFMKKMKLERWVMPFLKVCRKQRKKVGIVTNLTTKVQFQKIKKLKIGKYLDFILTSEQAGIEKPAKAFFKLALKKSRMKSADVLLVGDDPETDFCSFLDSVKLSAGPA